MKKLKLLLIGLMTAMLLAACGSSADTAKSQESSQTESMEQTTTTESDTEETTEAPSAQSVETDAEAENDTETVRSAVVYFSGTGTTRSIAEMIAEVTGSDLYEIIPEEIYSEDDLNYNDDNCRANKEQDDPDARPAIENDLSQVTDYEIIYLGHPIWWGTNPRIIQTFLDTYDLSNAKIYTFCTSGGSGIEKSISDLQSEYPNLNIISGKRLNNASMDDIEEWISSLE